jgi:hypothetical protein
MGGTLNVFWMFRTQISPLTLLVAFLSPFWQMPIQHIKSGHEHFLPHSFNSLFAKYPIIQSYILNRSMNEPRINKELQNPLWDLMFSQRWLWRVLFSGIQRLVVRWKSADASEEHVASIFRVKDYTKQETSVKDDGKQSSAYSSLTYSSTIKMDGACSSEKSVDFQRTTRRYIPEDRTLYKKAKFSALDCI